MSQIIIGYTTEGTTDIRLLSSIIQRTFVEVGLDCRTDIEIIDPIVFIDKEKGKEFNQQILACSKSAFEKGVMVFCIHVDSDANDDGNVFATKINPVLRIIADSDDEVCNNIVPLIPIQMSESWMLADKQLLKDEIGTDLTDNELGINRLPESIAHPKNTIIDAIRIARAKFTKRRRKDLDIADLYQPIGQKVSLEMLDQIPSYSKFKESVRSAYRQLNYLQ